jgi:hypothetical protein
MFLFSNKLDLNQETRFTIISLASFEAATYLKAKVLQIMFV